MNRRITKAMAIEAALKISRLAFDEKIGRAKKELDIVGEKVVKKRIPAPVIACTAEFSDYIDGTINVVFCVDGFKDLIHSKLNFRIPSASYYIYLPKEEAGELLEKYYVFHNLMESKERLRSQVYDSLVALRTEKAVEREMPEALKFIDFPNNAFLPAPVFAGLRDIISNISVTQKVNNND